jgi:hypothetical protein
MEPQVNAIFYYGECPVCEFSVVTAAVPPKLSSNCGLCAEDSGRDVWMRFREATTADKPEGYDARHAALDALSKDTP